MDTSILRVRSDVMEREVGAELSLYDPAHTRVTVLNATASDIWRLAAEGLSITTVTERLAIAYRTTPGMIEAEVRQTVAVLAAQGLLTVEGAHS